MQHAFLAEGCCTLGGKPPRATTQTQESPTQRELEDSSHGALQGYYVLRSSVMLAIGSQSLRGFDAAAWNPNLS